MTTKDYTCRTCKEYCISASHLAAHLGQSDHDTKWAKGYRTRQANRINNERDNDTAQRAYRESRSETYRRVYESNRDTEPIQKKIIRFFQELYEKQNLGFEDNEILTMINIAKRQAKVEVKP